MRTSIRLLLLILAFSVQAVAQWQNVGPEGGFVQSLLVNNGYVFAAVDSKLLRSTEGSFDWQQISSDEMTGTTPSDIVMYQNKITVAEPYRGIYQSSNDGTTWVQLNQTSLAQYGLSRMATDQNTMCVGTWGQGVLVSTDAGLTWVQKSDGLAGLSVRQVAIVNGRMFALTYNGLFLLDQNGQTWNLLTVPGQWIWGIFGLGNKLFLSSAGQYTSDDNGTTWVDISAKLQNSFLGLVSRNGTVYAWGGYGFSQSSDNGENWSAQQTMQFPSGAWAFGVSGSAFYVGTGEGGVQRSIDGGVTWGAVNQNMKCLRINSLESNGSTVFAGDEGGTVFCSIDDGGTWIDRGRPLGGGLQAMLFDGNDILAGGYGIARSNDGGATWNRILSDTWVYSLKRDGSDIVAGGQGAVSVGSNNGASWSVLGSGLPANYVVRALAKLGNVLFAGTEGGGVYMFDAGTGTWTPKNSGLGSPYIRALYQSSGRLLAGTFSGLYQSLDMGQTWQSVSSFLPTAVYRLKSFGSVLFAATSSGIRFSVDDGVAWIDYSSGLRNGQDWSAANDWDVDVTNTSVFAGSYGASVQRAALPSVVYLTFQVNMGVQIQSGTFNPATMNVVVRGDFQHLIGQYDWSGNSMVLSKSYNNESIYTIKFALLSSTANTTIHFKYVIVSPGGEISESIPDRGYTVTSEVEQLIPVDYFNGQTVPSVAHNITFQADLSDLITEGFSDATDSIEVIGNLHLTWPGIRLLKSSSNPTLYTRTITMHQVVGTVINYQFHADPVSKFTNNGWETTGQRSFTFQDNDLILPLVKPAIGLLNPTSLAAPTLALPANGATDQGTGQIFTWYPVASATTYRLQIADNSSFQSPVLDRTTNWIGWVFAPLDLNKTYYWRLDASNGTVTSGWSDTWSFRTIASYPVDVPSDSFHVDASVRLGGTEMCAAIAGVTKPDGKVRIVVGARSTGQLFVYSYDGTSYQQEWSAQIQQGAQIVPTAIGDADNDGNPEIIVNVVPTPWNSQSDGKIHMLRWNNSTYASALDQQLSMYAGLMPAAITDLDNDGKNELVILDGNVNIMRYSSSTGNFQNLWSSSGTPFDLYYNFQITTGDVDGDGRAEVIALPRIPYSSQNPSAETGMIIIGYNGSTYQIEQQLNGFLHGLGGAAVADFDGDKKVEIITGVTDYALGSHPIYLVKNVSGAYTISQIGSSPYGLYQVHAGDFDANGTVDADILRNAFGSYIVMYKNGRYQISFAGHVGSCIYGDAADTDQDGKAEIVACSYTSFDVVSWSLIPPLAAPVLSAPANSAVDQPTNINLQWNPVTGATSYKVQITTDQTFTTQVSEFGPISATNYNVDGLTVSTTYYWRVRASNSTTPPWSSTWSFTTGNGTLSAPVLAQPANGSTDQGLCINMIWNPASGATSYRLQVSTTSTFQQTIVDQSNIGTSWGGVTISPGTTLYWRVCATNGTATSNWSDTWNFTTLSNLPVIPVSSSFHIDESFTISGTNIRGAIAGATRGDGKVRIVAGTRTTGTLYVYLYDGTNYQLEWSGVIVPGAEIIPSAIGDADNDGNPEILVNVWPTPGYGPSDGKIHMLRWNGTGYAQVLEQQMNNSIDYLPAAIKDLDGDNKNELVNVGDQVNVLRYSQNSGKFETVWATTSTSYTFNNSIQVSTGDVDGDGRPEIVASVSVLPFNPNPTTAIALVIMGFNGSTYAVKAELNGFAQGLGGVAIADFDGDGTTEMVAGVFNYCIGTYPIYLIKRNGTGYTTTQLTVSPCGMFQARAADIDGDGLPDAEIFRNSNGSYFITYKAGAYQVALVEHSGAVVFGDLGDTDRDGRAEIITDGEVVSCVSTATLPPPLLLSPSNNATGQSADITLQWNPVNGATKYRVQVSTDQSFGSPVGDSGPISETMFSFYYPQLSYRTTYYWRVIASNPTSTSAWSAPWSFTTLTPVLPSAKTSWTYVKDFTNLTGGLGVQGLTVDPAGKIWITPYDVTEQVQTPNGIQSSRAIYVYTPDGQPASFSPIKFITVNGLTDTLFSSSRGLSTDPNGNILYSANSILYRINYRTGEGMARVAPQGSVVYPTLTAPASDQTGNVFVGRVWPGNSVQVFSPAFSYLGNVLNASTSFSRTIAASKDGRNIYWPQYTERKLYRYNSPNGAVGPYTNAGSIFDGLAIESMTWHPKTGFLWVSSGSEYDQPTAPYPILAWYALDLANGNIADTIAWNQTPGTLSGRPRAIAFSPTGDTVYVGCFFLNSNYVQMFHKVVQLSAYAAAGSTSTLNDLSNSGAQLTLTGGTGGVSVLMTSSVQPPAGSQPMSGQGLVGVGKYLDVTAFGSLQWPLQVKMYYTANDLTRAGLFEDELPGVYYWNAAGNQWKLYSQSGADDQGRGPSTTWVDPTNVVVAGVQYEGVIYANAFHLTPMALGGKLKSASVRFDELVSYVSKLPDDAFKKPADQRRSTLIDKIQRSKSQFTSGNVKGATQTIQQDIVNHLASNGNSGNDLWVTNETAGLTLIRLFNELVIVMQRPQPAAKEFAAGEVEQTSDIIPTDFTLYQNYPNPFNPTTRIAFDLPKISQVSLTIYNVLGQAVSRLVDGPLAAGSYSFNFAADHLSAGIYYYVLTADDFKATKKMVLLR